MQALVLFSTPPDSSLQFPNPYPLFPAFAFTCVISHLVFTLSLSLILSPSQFYLPEVTFLTSPRQLSLPPHIHGGSQSFSLTCLCLLPTQLPASLSQRLALLVSFLKHCSSSYLFSHSPVLTPSRISTGAF